VHFDEALNIKTVYLHFGLREAIGEQGGVRLVLHIWTVNKQILSSHQPEIRKDKKEGKLCIEKSYIYNVRKSA